MFKFCFLSLFSLYLSDPNAFAVNLFPGSGAGLGAEYGGAAVHKLCAHTLVSTGNTPLLNTPVEGTNRLSIMLKLTSVSKLLQPLMQRRQEHEKKRRDIKEQWQRAKRKLVCSRNRICSLSVRLTTKQQFALLLPVRIV